MTTIADPLDQALAWLAEGRAVALATVVSTWGSAPRRPGSHMAIDDRGRFAGSVSGGCVEVAVVEAARAALAAGEPALLDYGVADDDAWAVGLACGGSIRVLVTPVGAGPRALPDALVKRMAAVGPGHAGAVVAFPLDGAAPRAAADLPGLAPADVAAALRSGEGRLAEAEPGPTFLRPYLPPPRIVIVGAVHIAQSLVALARIAGFDTVIIDPRPDFASAERFPGTLCLDCWPEEGLRRATLDPRTAVVTLTHNPRLDDPALLQAVRSPAFHVGALGSRRTHARRLDRLRAEGADEAELARIRAPAGLDLGGRSPEEIALAILAEIVAELRGGRARAAGSGG